MGPSIVKISPLSKKLDRAADAGFVSGRERHPRTNRDLVIVSRPKPVGKISCHFSTPVPSSRGTANSVMT